LKREDGMRMRPALHLKIAENAGLLQNRGDLLQIYPNVIMAA
jgi:hypothetical protein